MITNGILTQSILPEKTCLPNRNTGELGWNLRLSMLPEQNHRDKLLISFRILAQCLKIVDEILKGIRN